MLKFTRKDAREMFDRLPVSLPLHRYEGLEDCRIALVLRAWGYQFNWQDLPTEDVKGWVPGINAKLFYNPQGVRQGVGASVDYIYLYVNKYLKRVNNVSDLTKTEIIKPVVTTPIPQRVEATGESKILGKYTQRLEELTREVKKSGARGPQLAHIVRQRLMDEFKGSWAQRGTEIVFRPTSEPGRVIVIDTQGL